MNRNKAIVVAILAVVVGVLFVVLRGGSEPKVEPKAALSPPPRRPAHKPLSMGQLYAEGQAKAGGEPLKADGPDAVSARGLDDTLAEVLDSDPNLRKFYELRRKAVRTSAEQQDYLAMIADEKLIDAARADLLAGTSATEIDQGEELKRLQRIQFLNSALAWGDNPHRGKALEAASAVVLQDVPKDASKSVAGSVLGDKFDLFQVLMLSDPEQAQALLAKARGTSSEKILQLAWQTGSPANAKKNEAQ